MKLTFDELRGRFEQLHEKYQRQIRMYRKHIELLAEENSELKQALAIVSRKLAENHNTPWALRSHGVKLEPGEECIIFSHRD